MKSVPYRVAKKIEGIIQELTEIEDDIAHGNVMYAQEKRRATLKLKRLRDDLNSVIRSVSWDIKS